MNTSRFNQEKVERIIEEVTREVLLRLNEPESQEPSCNCTDGSCAEHCPDKLDEVVQAGAARVSATLGTRPVTGDVARMIDHTLLKPDATVADFAARHGLLKGTTRRRTTVITRPRDIVL